MRIGDWSSDVCSSDLPAAVITGGEYHAFGHAELHLAWCEVGDHDGQTVDKCLRCVSRLDASEHLPGAEHADVERQPQQLVCAVDMFGRGDARDAQIGRAHV